MTLADDSIDEYLSTLAARKSVPGGGAVAAVTGAQAAALISMVAEFSDKSLATDSRNQIIEQAQAARHRFLELAEQDATNFMQLMASYNKNTGIQDALMNAARPPLACLELAGTLCPLVSTLDEFGNPNLVTDTGIAALLIGSTIRSSEMNILVNLRSIEEETFLHTAKRDIAAQKDNLTSIDAIARKVSQELS